MEDIFVSFVVDQKKTRKFNIPQICFPPLGLLYDVSKIRKKNPPAKSSK